MNEETILTKGYRKVIMSGTTLYVSLPREVREILEAKKGDRIMVAFYNDKVKGKSIKQDIYERPKEKETSIFIKEDEEETLPMFDFSKDKDGNN